MNEIKPHIGKNVIETLTLGMYEDARIVYREYVQNSADAIDDAVEKKLLFDKSEGRISIAINESKGQIIIEDNGTGIKAENVLSFLGDVANSQKDVSKQKGFRGIGRLGGLGYCGKLIFETSFHGEGTKSIITLDSKLLKLIIENTTNTDDAATVMGTITSIKKMQTDKDSHYFRVTLMEVQNENLLDEKSIADYLSMVAPIPFSPEFEFKEKIYAFFQSNKRRLDEYDVELSINNRRLYKPYKSIFYKTNNSGTKKDAELLDVSCFTIQDKDYELLAIGWFGITDKLNYQIPDENIERGVRLRKENITIGNELTLSKLYGQSRQNLNYIGEVHAFGSEFKPNARRDYFNDSKTTSVLEEKLKSVFAKLGSLTQDSSQLHNRKNDIENYRTKLEEYEESIQSGQFTHKEIVQKRDELLNSKDKAIYSSEQLLKLKDKSAENELLKVIYEHIIGPLKIKINDTEFDLESNVQTYQLTLAKLNVEQRNLVNEIFTIIEENFTVGKAEFIKKKIAEKYN
ncbi:ATP-binding protein [Zunongwangia sp. F260]|uniref:ATP-binding protein n=1 Tax=Autumnicola lenta TaxID=3075593 RepID=A0ABU3CKS2_9FLAO|nr:ATP-binding protein [Zunongwangia sp. F260]MDT0646954.1 ATP-binding protein [Zunongwangia sp. F260]